jgi:hypothetical protein
MRGVTYPHAYIAKQFEFRGYVLLDRYAHSKTKMQVKCPKGHITSLSWGSFRDGHRCMVCGHERQAAANSRQVGSKNHQWNPDREQVRQNKEASIRQFNMLKSVLKRIGTSKTGHIYEILGYSAQQLQEHLQSFSRYTYLQGTHTLAIDHVFPIKAFLDCGIKNPAIICALSNLQPLSKSENSEKHDLYDKEAFKQYCQTHGVILGCVHG